MTNFPDLEYAVSTVQEIIQFGIPIARLELLYEDQMQISIEYSKLDQLESDYKKNIRDTARVF